MKLRVIASTSSRVFFFVALTDLHSVVTQRGDEDVTLTLPQAIQQGTQRGQLSHLHTENI